MGIYIKGMEKPQGCRDCELLHKWDDERYRCPFISYLQWVEYDNIEDYIVSDDCPLVEVKTPHGRLIDADALADDLEYDAANEQDFYKANCASWLRSNCNQTIIEAEAK